MTLNIDRQYPRVTGVQRLAKALCVHDKPEEVPVSES